jgi:hypothetical protein
MNRWMVGIGLALLLMTAVTGFALAEDGGPIGGCPDGFELHLMGEHPHHGDGDHPHQHVGNDKDQNGDGWLCVKHVGQNGAIHVHIDNSVPMD